MNQLIFINKDATPKRTEVQCDAASVDNILSWYAPFHDGDRYSVTLNGKKLKLDHNGERG